MFDSRSRVPDDSAPSLQSILRTFRGPVYVKDALEILGSVAEHPPANRGMASSVVEDFVRFAAKPELDQTARAMLAILDSGSPGDTDVEEIMCAIAERKELAAPLRAELINDMRARALSLEEISGGISPAKALAILDRIDPHRAIAAACETMAHTSELLAVLSNPRDAAPERSERAEIGKRRAEELLGHARPILAEGYAVLDEYSETLEEGEYTRAVAAFHRLFEFYAGAGHASVGFQIAMHSYWIIAPTAAAQDFDTAVQRRIAALCTEPERLLADVEAVPEMREIAAFTADASQKPDQPPALSSLIFHLRQLMSNPELRRRIEGEF
jgi:hypothetical protein